MTDNFYFVINLPVIYDYLDETDLTLLKSVSSKFYDIICYLVSNDNKKANKISLSKICKGTFDLIKSIHKLKKFDDKQFIFKLIKYSSVDIVSYFIKSGKPLTFFGSWFDTIPEARKHDDNWKFILDFCEKEQ